MADDEFAGFKEAPVADEYAGFTPVETAPPAATGTSAPERSLGSTLAHQGKQLLKGGANALAAPGLMAEDFGVAARNVLGNAVNKVMGNSATPDYELPSETFHKGMNEVFGAPENTVEKVNDVVLPMIMGGAGASEQAPGAIRALMQGPEAATQVPSNFMNPTDQKRQILAQTIKKGQDLGLVVPPQTTNPGAANAAIETVGGKIATQQAAAVHNQPIANAVAAKALGLNPDAPITVPGLRQVIKEAGQGYQDVRRVGNIPVDKDYLQSIADVAHGASGAAASFPGSKVSPLVAETDSLFQPSFDASHAVDKIAELRDASSIAYAGGDTRLGAGYRQLSKALEDQIDRHISTDPNTPSDVVSKFRTSRQLMAKAHSVLDALNSSTGDVSIQDLAKSGDPLSGDLKTLADFGNAAPKATQNVAKIGSHGVSHLDTLGTMFTGAFGEHVAGPVGMAAGAAYPIARWGARAYALGPGQARALPKAFLGAGEPSTKTASAFMEGSENAATEPSDDIQRASGGKVDIDALVSKLIQRWKAAKKETDASTKPLLNVPDAAIQKALDIAQAHI